MSTETDLLKNMNLKKHIENEIMKNEVIKTSFFKALEETQTEQLEATQSILLFELISLGKQLSNADFTFFLRYIKDGKITNKIQVQETISFLKLH